MEIARADRRTILIRRTGKDRNLETTYVQVSEEMTNLFYEGFSPREIDDFESCLKQILANLAKYN